jgi:hypothetical protein
VNSCGSSGITLLRESGPEGVASDGCVWCARGASRLGVEDVRKRELRERLERNVSERENSEERIDFYHKSFGGEYRHIASQGCDEMG